MILRRFRGELMVVRQVDHGSQTGEFARAWGGDQIPEPHRAEATRAAGKHHDDGWAQWDGRPTLAPTTGQPVQFVELTPFEHVPIYRRGIAAAAARDPYVGLLVSMHGAGIYNDRYGTVTKEQELSDLERALVEEFLADQTRAQTQLGLQAGLDSTHNPRTPGPYRPVGHVTAFAGLWHDYLLLQLWDRLSLQFLFGQAVDATLCPLPGMPAGSGLVCRHKGELAMSLDPYPFGSDDAEFPAAGRLLPDRRYSSPEDFLATLSSASEEWFVCRTTAS